MGLFSNKELLSLKYTTAIIIDQGNRGFIIPIKNVLDDIFITTIEKQIFCFRLDGSRLITVRHTLQKAFNLYIFFTDNFLPVAGADINKLEQVLRTNNLPRVSYNLYGMFKLLANKEKHNKKEFTPHDLVELINNIESKEKEYPEQVENLRTFINQLGTDQIVTPVKRVTEFLENELLVTSPRYLGIVAEQFRRTDQEQKKMSNTPLTGKGPMLKIILLIVLIGAVGGIAYMLYSSGMIGGITIPNGNPGQSGGPLTPSQITSKYPTPEALKAAIDRGEIKYNELPPSFKAMVDKIKPQIAQ